MRIQFLGAASEVTGSCRLFTAAGKRFLLDCGMFQGNRTTHSKNRSALDAKEMGFEPKDLDFVLLSHAHGDHCGLLPLLYARGYRGQIHATHASADLATIIMQDSAYIQESEARVRNKIAAREALKQGQAQPQLEEAPIYTIADAKGACQLFTTHVYGEIFTLAPGIEARFTDAGHILGSAIVEIFATENGVKQTFVFSGDLGQPNRPIVQDPSPVRHGDFVMIESTYGNRLHKPTSSTREELARILNETLPKGNVVIPAFALGRTQELLVMLAQLAKDGKIPHATVYIDSPLAQKATQITLKHAAITDAASQEILKGITAGTLPITVKFTETADDSKGINLVKQGAVIIAGSGMCEAGRIRHHLLHHLGNPNSAVVFTGYQADGSLGRRLVEGAKEAKLFGELVPVKARIHTVGGLSAHGDQAALIGWLSGFDTPPKKLFLVHGEPNVLVEFAQAIKTQLGWDAHIAQAHEALELG
jgi:metallo-beta-lactamase family protein